jgi:hypothetical protein
MPPLRTRFEPSQVKNKMKREELTRKKRKDRTQEKLKRRLAIVKAEEDDPEAKKVHIQSSLLELLLIYICSEGWRKMSPLHSTTLANSTQQ